jgi:hypothetical protein
MRRLFAQSRPEKCPYNSLASSTPEEMREYDNTPAGITHAHIAVLLRPSLAEIIPRIEATIRLIAISVHTIWNPERICNRGISVERRTPVPITAAAVSITMPKRYLTLDLCADVT